MPPYPEDLASVWWTGLFVHPCRRYDIFSPEGVINNGQGMGTMNAMESRIGNEQELLETFGKHKHRCSHDFEYLCSKELLVDRKGAGSPVPFLFNRAQKHVWDRLKEQWTREGIIRVNILKGRQQGMSILVVALIFWKAVTNGCLNATLGAKDYKSTKSLFDKIKRFTYDRPIDWSIGGETCSLDEIHRRQQSPRQHAETDKTDRVALESRLAWRPFLTVSCRRVISHSTILMTLAMNSNLLGREIRPF
jgi:hypothetical protein